MPESEELAALRDQVLEYERAASTAGILSARLNSQRKEISSTRTELFHTKSALDAKNSEISRLAAELVTTKRALSEARSLAVSPVRANETESVILHDRIHGLESDLNLAQREAAELRQLCSTLRAELSSALDGAVNSARLRDELESTQRTIAELKQEVQRARRATEEAQAARAAADQQVTASATTRAELSSVTSQLYQARAEAEACQAEMAALRLRCTEAESDLASARAKAHSAQDEAAALQDQAAQVASSAQAQLAAECGALRGQVTSLQQERATLAARVAEADASAKQARAQLLDAQSRARDAQCVQTQGALALEEGYGAMLSMVQGMVELIQQTDSVWAGESPAVLHAQSAAVRSDVAATAAGLNDVATAGFAACRAAIAQLQQQRDSAIEEAQRAVQQHAMVAAQVPDLTAELQDARSQLAATRRAAQSADATANAAQARARAALSHMRDLEATHTHGAQALYDTAAWQAGDSCMAEHAGIDDRFESRLRLARTTIQRQEDYIKTLQDALADATQQIADASSEQVATASLRESEAARIQELEKELHATRSHMRSLRETVAASQSRASQSSGSDGEASSAQPLRVVADKSHSWRSRAAVAERRNAELVKALQDSNAQRDAAIKQASGLRGEVEKLRAQLQLHQGVNVYHNTLSTALAAAKRRAPSPPLLSSSALAVSALRAQSLRASSRHARRTVRTALPGAASPTRTLRR